MTATLSPPTLVPHVRPDGSWEPLRCSWCGADWTVARGPVAACSAHWDTFVGWLCHREEEGT